MATPHSLRPGITPIAASLAMATLGSAAHAADIVKADTTNSLNTAASWVGGVVPGPEDRVVVNTTLTASRTAAVGGNLSIAGIQYIAGQQFQVSATTNATLTVGALGIEVNPTGVTPLIIVSQLALSAPQTWTLGTGKFLQVNGPFSDGGNALSITGAGTFDLRGSNTFGSNVTIDVNQVNVNAANVVVRLGGANTFNAALINNGRMIVSSIGDYGVASNLGDGGTNSTVTLGGNATNGILEYDGATSANNRTFLKDRRATASGIEVSNASATLTLNGNLGATTGGTAIGATSWQLGGVGNLVVNGVISNSTATTPDVIGVTKFGTGSLTLGGPNTFTGSLRVESGSVLLSDSERLNDAVNLFLANDTTFSTQGFSETLGTLNVAGAATLQLGANGGVSFADSSSIAWLGTLTISGDFQPGSYVRFGNSAAGLTSLQLSQIVINGFNNLTIDDSGYLSLPVVPEPSTWAALGLGGLLAFGVARRRRA